MAFTSDGTLLAKLSEDDRILLWPRDGSAPGSRLGGEIVPQV